MGEWFLSRRDSTIVARHEVPGIMRKIARPSGTIEPIPSDPNFSTGVPGVSEAAGAFDALSLAHAWAQFSTTNICGNDNDFELQVDFGARFTGRGATAGFVGAHGCLLCSVMYLSPLRRHGHPADQARQSAGRSRLTPIRTCRHRRQPWQRPPRLPEADCARHRR